MSFELISNYDEALEFLGEDIRAYTLFKTWIPKNRFIEILYSKSGISMFRDDSTPIAFAVGSNPPLRENWKRMNLERGASSLGAIDALERSDWETYFYEVPKKTLSFQDSLDREDLEIEEFLKEHAPKSSVFPGHKEILEWIRVDQDNELVGVAALCRWESGEHVIASVATHSKLRGRGIGRAVMKQALAVAQRHSIERLCLGVNSDNPSAIDLYEKAGWSPLYKFTYILRP